MLSNKLTKLINATIYYIPISIKNTSKKKTKEEKYNSIIKMMSNLFYYICKFLVH